MNKQYSYIFEEGRVESFIFPQN